MINDSEIARIGLEEYHRPGLADVISEGFGDDSLKASDNYWETVSKILSSEEPFSLGLKGAIRLDHGNISHGSPMYLFTNRLTNPKEYSVQANRLDDLTLFGFSDGTFYLQSMNKLLHINPITTGRNIPVNGVNIAYKTRLNANIPDGEVNEFSIMSDEISGFCVSHNKPRIFSLEFVDELLDKHINSTSKK